MTVNISGNTNNIRRNKINRNTGNAVNFAGTQAAAESVTKGLPVLLKPVAKLASFQENSGGGGFAMMRFIQDTVINWGPKALFARSVADLAEVSFLEFLESGIFYGLPAVLGNKVLKKNFSKLVSQDNQKFITEPYHNLKKFVAGTLDKDYIANNKILKDAKVEDVQKALKEIAPVKAGIVLGTTCVIGAEYALSFAKNLFTLKTFKTADFNNIANLEKGKKENQSKQKKVEKSAYSHIIGASIVSALGLAAGIALAVKGRKSPSLQKLSENILAPGTKLCESIAKKKNTTQKAESGSRKFAEKFLNFDFNGSFDKKGKGKLSLGPGQLFLAVSIGVLGYLKAAKDRGKLDFLEVASRVPISATYTIFGADLFEEGFKQRLSKGEKTKGIYNFDKDGIAKIKTFEELRKAASTAADPKAAYRKLAGLKSIAELTPFAIGLMGTGIGLSALNRYWTKARYNKGIGQDKTTQDPQDIHMKSEWISMFAGKNLSESKTFKDFVPADDQPQNS